MKTSSHLCRNPNWVKLKQTAETIMLFIQHNTSASSYGKRAWDIIRQPTRVIAQQWATLMEVWQRLEATCTVTNQKKKYKRSIALLMPAAAPHVVHPGKDFAFGGRTCFEHVVLPGCFEWCTAAPSIFFVFKNLAFFDS